MPTATELKAAYRAVIRADLSDDQTQAIMQSGLSLDAYIASLVSQAVSTTGAAVGLTAFITGLTPSSVHLDELKHEAELQFASYAKLGVANPSLGPFEAFGRSLATDPTTKATFVARYGELSTTDFVNKIYSEIYCGKISEGAFANLSAQVAYFTDMLGKANAPDAALAAKGAALGQLIGYAFLEPDIAKNAVIDDQTAAILTKAAKGDESIYGKELPFMPKPCDVIPPQPTGAGSGPATPPDTTPPVFTSAAQATVAENTAAATIIYQAAATDPSGPIAYSLAGADKNLFSIDAGTGAVRFLASPDFENPQDAGANNIYDINVIATDAVGNAATKAVAITVTDVAENPSIWRASVDGAGAQTTGNHISSVISANGRYVAFRSTATTLVANDTNGVEDVFVYDNVAKTMTLVSLSSAGAQGNGASQGASVSGDGRYIAFHSAATNLVAGDTNGKQDIFVRDTLNNTTTLVSVGSGNVQGNGDSINPAISDDGRYVAFESSATNLVAGDAAGKKDIFLHDMQTGTTIRVSNGLSNAEANADSFTSAISADGGVIAFQSNATNLVANDTNNRVDFFAFNTQTNVTTRVNVDSQNNQADTEAGLWLSLSADGRYVVFQSTATNLVANDTNGVRDIFRHDNVTGETVRVSVDSNGNQGNANSFFNAVSANGRYVAFQSDASNLVAGDTNLSYDIFVRDMTLNKTYRVSVGAGGQQAFGANPLAAGNADSTNPNISDDGRYITFTSVATNLVPGDTNGTRDIFVIDGQAQGWWFP